MKKTFSFAMAFILFSLTGCTKMIGDFTVISTHNIELQANHVLVKRAVIGSSMTTSLFYFINFGEANLKSAVDNSLWETGADFLTNARVYTRSWSLILISREGYIVKGDAWKNASPPPTETGMRGFLRRGHDFELVWDNSENCYWIQEI